jgi:hypothetical protein
MEYVYRLRLEFPAKYSERPRFLLLHEARLRKLPGQLQG